MRGKAIICRNMGVNMRITPAHAGKSIDDIITLGKMGDHPRACGEKRAFVLMLCETLGSPPRMRGKDPVFLLVFLCTGITPAHAGKR